MAVFPHHELRYYLFGVRTGIASLRANGWSLGLRKTLGKISQPINAPSRFPEYFLFDAAIREFLAGRADAAVRVLDVGSPKLLGLYLGRTIAAELHLTDISELNVDEYRLMWRAIEPGARGRVSFSLQDARSLPLPAGAVDVVYSMSVVEHIEGEHGDAAALREMQRVLKPGGLLVVSVPFGRRYVEQQRIGFAGAARRTGDAQAYFFQRIYDRMRLQQRILDPLHELEPLRVTTVRRRNTWLAGAMGRLGENLRGLLGCVNPFLSAAVNTIRPGIDDDFNVRYGPVHTARDVYGDIVVVGRKRAASG